MDSNGLSPPGSIDGDDVFARAQERVRRGEVIDPLAEEHPDGFDSEEEFENFLVWLYNERRRVV